MSPGMERDLLNNQKRIIRELKRIADALEIMAGTSARISLTDYVDALEIMAGTSARISLTDYVDAASNAASLMQREDDGK